MARSAPQAKKNVAPKLWALLDCESFYCSCERLFRPDLANRPVAVLSNNDGCLVALTSETKTLGFKLGDPYFREAERLKEAGVAVFSSNYALYGDLSRRVVSCLETLVPDVRPYSIDEAFIPLDRVLAERAEEVGWEMLNRVQTWVGVPTRVGLGPTRTLAKLANRWAKKKKRVFPIPPKGDELTDLLAQTPVANVWGVGRALAQRLARLGATTALDLCRLDPAVAKRELTVKGLRTVWELNGLDSIDEDLCPAPPKTLTVSRSFGSKVADFEPLMAALTGHCEALGARLRSEGLLTPALTVFIGTAHYLERPFHAGAAVELKGPTNYTPALIKAARRALTSCFRPGLKYARAGVTAFDLRSDQGETSGLFAAPAYLAGRADLMATVDRINGRYGRGTVGYTTGQGTASWRTRFDRRSPFSTTDWGSLPEVKA
jgi:DNA polymerase V